MVDTGEKSDLDGNADVLWGLPDKLPSQGSSLGGLLFNIHTLTVLI